MSGDAQMLSFGLKTEHGTLDIIKQLAGWCDGDGAGRKVKILCWHWHIAVNSALSCMYFSVDLRVC